MFTKKFFIFEKLKFPFKKKNIPAWAATDPRARNSH